MGTIFASGIPKKEKSHNSLVTFMYLLRPLPPLQDLSIHSKNINLVIKQGTSLFGIKLRCNILVKNVCIMKTSGPVAVILSSPYNFVSYDSTTGALTIIKEFLFS